MAPKVSKKPGTPKKPKPKVVETPKPAVTSGWGWGAAVEAPPEVVEEPVTPGRGRSRKGPRTPLSRSASASRLREVVDESSIHLLALEDELEKLTRITNVRQDKEGKNFIRYLNSRDKHGNTALMNACWKGHLRVVHFLVESGASLNLQNFYGWTALMWAVNHDCIRVVDFLIEKGADLKISTPVGRTAIDFANDKEIRLRLQTVLDRPVAAPKLLKEF